ncbi:zinc finger protein Xfin-like [Chironomus tepperi]|uniref:zinc finger protein Xfin-like n=1 Tax=Chironomus tepperi TaxID=113505 RepID=UPI00391F835A
MDTSLQSSNRKLCRACLRQYESRKDLIPLQSFDQNSPSSAKIRFHDMLSSIMHQNLPESDSLPSKICIMCLSSLRVSYYFRLEVEKSQAALSKKLISSNIRITIKEEVPGASNFPVILRPRHVENDAFNASNVMDQVLMDTDDEIIDYEPDLDSVMDYSEQGSPSKNSDIQNDTIKSTDASKLNNSIEGSDKGDFDCTECQKPFTSYKALQCHKRTIHSANKCKYCQKKFGNKQQLKLHIRFKHRDKYSEYCAENDKSMTETDAENENDKKPVVLVERLEKFNECSTCDLIFVNKLALVKHHADCDSKCIDCGLKIPRKDFYFKHLETVHKYPCIDLAGYECPFCMNLFRTEKVLQEHIQRIHPDESQSNVDTLSEAGESTSTDGITSHQCKVCLQNFQSSKSLKQHTTVKHKERDANINQNTDKKLSSNVRKYTKDEFFEKFIVKKSIDFYRCIPCRKDIYKRSVMLHAKSKHAAIRCHRCELCSEAFFRTDYRTRHFAMAHPNDYKCIECDMQFDRAYKYEAHMTQHGQIQKILKPEEGADRYDLSPQDIYYIEDSSTYDYTNDDLLLTVSNTEQNQSSDEVVPLSKDEFCDKYMVTISDKNVKCNICNVEMLRNSVVSHMMWKHALVKPLKCSFCNDRVVKNNARLAHMARCHPNEYKCVECNIQFAKHTLYADHFKDYHNSRVTSNPSTGEEDDLTINDMRFVSNRNDDEIIEESDNISIETTTSFAVAEKTYACQFCPKKFTSSKNLTIHKSHKHKSEYAEMLAQDTSYDPMEPITFDEFKQNWVEVINENDLKCLVCELVMRKKNFGAHLRSKHCVSGAYLCALCPERFIRAEHRIQHMTQNHRGIFYCNSCSIQFYRNSRYSKHMSELHGIEIDDYDSYEVDLSLYELKFVPFVQKIPEDDQLSITSSTINEPDPIEGMMQMLTTSEEMTRNEFMSRYIKVMGKERHCLACDKTFYHSSIYHHLIHLHSTVLPFKCPFCDVRFERTVQRAKHLQMFHPEDYKCNECGVQFSKHVKYSEHMSSEHNIVVTTQKSPLEIRDLSSLDLKYVAQKSMDENLWQEDESAFTNSNEYPEYQDDSSNAPMHIKSDKPEIPTISYVEDDQLVEIPAPKNVAAPSLEDELPYLEFKAKYVESFDGSSSKCLACNSIILKTSVCAHMRLWHATAMIFNCELCPIGFRRGDYRMRHMSLQHPDSYKCPECSTQFYYSAMFKEHVWAEHKIKMDVPVLKHKDDIDVPLENLMFAPYVPKELRLHPDESGNRHGGRRRNSFGIEVPTTSKRNAEDGYTYREFYNKYVEPRGETSKCTACNRIYSKLSIKKHIKREHCTRKPFNCQLCDEGFLRTDERVAHMKKHHPDSFKCLMCDVQFHLSTRYIEHMSSEHSMTLNISSNKSEHEVDIPFDRLRFKPNLNNQNGSGSSINQSSDGGMSRDDFTSKYLTRFHVDGELYLQCSACNKSIAAKQKRFHLLQHHAKLRPFGCELCESRFFSNFKRIKHMEFHHPNDFKCQICNQQFEKSEIYANHMQEEHKLTIKVNSNADVDINGDEMLYYEKVTKTKPTSANVTSNNMEESDNSSFNLLETLHCDVCNIDCDSSRSYRQHMRDHVGGVDSLVQKPEIKLEKPPEDPETPQQLYPCDLCDKQLTSIVARNAHRKFKHGVYKEKQTTPSQKVEIVCEVCEFTSYRRDYLEHHMKQQHKGEFKCPYCKRALSSYNYYAYHLETNHQTKPDQSQLFKCSDCDNYFKIEENLQKHKAVYHGENPPQRSHFCKLCTMNFRASSHLVTHLETYTHRNLINFFNGTSPSTSKSVKDEPCDKNAIENHSVNDYDKELEQNDSKEPEPKRLKLSSEESITENDKLEYLKYLQTTESGHFKCGICGKVKSLRKYMLHHLKQHKEVPTYDCDKCPERFVFKTKYDKHMELHENGEISAMNGTASSTDQSVKAVNSTIIEPKEAVVEDEHPKFQEMKKTPPEIKCTVCNLSFKLTIMLNKHNSTWHSDSNPYRELTMSDQKHKKSNEQISVIRFLRCGHCNEAFIKQDELDNHVKAAHNENNEDDDEDDEDMDIESATKFSCERCPLKFHNIKFLENHQKFFCIHRNQPKLVNEQ